MTQISSNPLRDRVPIIPKRIKLKSNLEIDGYPTIFEYPYFHCHHLQCKSVKEKERLTKYRNTKLHLGFTSFVRKKSTFTNPSKAYIKDLIMSSGFQTLKAHYSKSQIFVQKFNLPRFYSKTFFLGKSKLSIFTHFFFFDNFFVKSKLSTPKKCKTQQFLECFTQFFFGKSSWTKIEDFELCGFQGS